MQDDLRIGVDLGGTKTEAVVVRVGRGRGEEGIHAAEHGAAEESGHGVTRASIDGDPEVLARARIPTARIEGYDHIVAQTRALVLDVAKTAGLAGRELPPIGVGMPGSISTRSGAPVVKNSNTTCLNGRPFRADLTRAIGREIAFANDANCFALAEATWGAARSGRVVFGVILGTGVGGGVVVRDGFATDGAPRAWDGAQGIAGEWGHVALEPETGPPCYCGRRGCIETLLSGPAIEKAYAARSGAAAPLVEIAARAAGGADVVAHELFVERIEIFGRALATVIDVLDPDVVVLGGGVSNLDVLYDEGARAVARWVFNDELRTRIVKHALGDSAGVLGAALLR